jgi:hypothetical protein
LVWVVLRMRDPTNMHGLPVSWQWPWVGMRLLRFLLHPESVNVFEAL